MSELLEIVVIFEDDSIREFNREDNSILDDLVADLESKLPDPSNYPDNRILLRSLAGNYVSGRQLIMEIINDASSSRPEKLDIVWNIEGRAVTARVLNTVDENCYLVFEKKDKAITVRELIEQLQQCDPDKEVYVLFAEIDDRGFASEPVVQVDNSSKESTVLLTWDYQK